MKTLDKYNEEISELIRRDSETAHLSGVLCPECKKIGKDVEMHIENPNWQNSSFPPTQWVHCPECDYRGLKIV